MRVGLIILSGVLSTSQFIACSQSCTEMGCIPGVIVDLSEPLSEPGEYRVRVEADGTAMTCTTTVPQNNTDSCSDARLSLFGRGEQVRTGDAVSELPPQNLAGFFVDGEFEMITIRIEYAGQLIAMETLMPQYQGVEINGPGCGECPSATHELTVQPSSGANDAGADAQSP